MPLAFLLNVPTDDNSWQQFAWNNQTILAAIRQAIQDQTGNITSITTTNNGSGYTSAPTVTITDARGNGTGAVATATYTVTNNEYNITVSVVAEGAGYLEPQVSFSGGGGTGATAQVGYNPVVILTEYQTYPIDVNDPIAFQFWLLQNSQAHDDFNSQLNLQSSDLTDLDIKNENQLQSWIYLNYSELRNACFALNIS